MIQEGGHPTVSLVCHLAQSEIQGEAFPPTPFHLFTFYVELKGKSKAVMLSDLSAGVCWQEGGETEGAASAGCAVVEGTSMGTVLCSAQPQQLIFMN